MQVGTSVSMSILIGHVHVTYKPQICEQPPLLVAYELWDISWKNHLVANLVDHILVFLFSLPYLYLGRYRLKNEHIN